MKRSKLESYASNQRLIKRNKQKIEEEEMRGVTVIKGKVKGSSPDFPYIEQRFSVEMDDPVEAQESSDKIRKWSEAIEKAEKDIEEVEKFIFSIPDTKDREIFIYRYMDNKNVTTVGKIVGYTKGRISQIVSKYVKD